MEKDKEEIEFRQTDFDDVKGWLDENQENKQWLAFIRPVIDKAVSNGIESYKNNHMGKEVDSKLEEQSKNFKDKETNLMKRENLLELRELALQKSIEKGVNPEIGLKMIGDDIESTTNNLNTLFSEIDASSERKWIQHLKNSAHTPQAGDDKPNNTLKNMIRQSKDPEYFESNKDEIYKRMARGEPTK